MAEGEACDTVDTIVVRPDTDTGISGWGEVCPVPHYLAAYADGARPEAAPSFAATVISRASLENIFDRAASCRPLRCMMFLNCEWPAMASPRRLSKLLDWPRLIGILPVRVKAERGTDGTGLPA